MSQLAYFCVFLILLITIHVTEGSPCGPAELIGPLNKNGFSERLVNLKVNLSDTIVIKCQLSRTDPNVNYGMYNPMLIIYVTSLRDGKDLYPIVIRKRDKFQILKGDVMNYSISITANETLDRSVIICGANYQPHDGMAHEYCYSGSAAVIITEDHDPCTPSETTPDDSTTKLTTTSPPTAADTEGVTMKKVVLFPVLSIAILVGIILLVANGIQLWVIIINRRAAKAVHVSATNGIALNHFSSELEQHGTDQNCAESVEDTTTI